MTIYRKTGGLRKEEEKDRKLFYCLLNDDQRQKRRAINGTCVDLLNGGSPLGKIEKSEPQNERLTEANTMRKKRKEHGQNKNHFRSSKERCWSMNERMNERTSEWMDKSMKEHYKLLSTLNKRNCSCWCKQTHQWPSIGMSCVITAKNEEDRCEESGCCPAVVLVVVLLVLDVQSVSPCVCSSQTATEQSVWSD